MRRLVLIGWRARCDYYSLDRFGGASTRGATACRGSCSWPVGRHVGLDKKVVDKVQLRNWDAFYVGRTYLWTCGAVMTLERLGPRTVEAD